MASATVIAAGKPSGIADTAKATGEKTDAAAKSAEKKADGAEKKAEEAKDKASTDIGSPPKAAKKA